jgi:hypothetical protein
VIIEELKLRNFMWDKDKYIFNYETKTSSFIPIYIEENPLAQKELRYMFKNNRWKIFRDGKYLESHYNISFMGNSRDSVARQAWKEFVAKRNIIEEKAENPWKDLYGEYQEKHNGYINDYVPYVRKELIPYAPYNEMWRNGPVPLTDRYLWNLYINCAPKNKHVDRYKLVRPAFLDLELTYYPNGRSSIKFVYHKPHFKGSKKLGTEHSVYSKLDKQKQKDMSNLLDNGLIIVGNKSEHYRYNSMRIKFNKKTWRNYE